tara:strand:+ start:287 stop:1030 length:744 start_codon:yes stop_codon:yes gene_type:complete
MKHEKVIDVYKTKDYGIFSYVEGNRNTAKKHIRELIESFSERQLAVPIVVDKDFKIYDGQHRMEAIKQLSLPVFYIVLKDLGIRDIQLLNASSKNWTNDQYAESYNLPGSKNRISYEKYLEHRKKYRIGMRETLQVMTGRKDNKSLEKSFRIGNFICKNYKKACEIGAMVLDIKPYYKSCKKREFVNAIIHMYNWETYDHSHFMRRLKKQPELLLDHASTGAYKLNIEEIYNKGVLKTKYVRLFDYK